MDTRYQPLQFVASQWGNGRLAQKGELMFPNSKTLTFPKPEEGNAACAAHNVAGVVMAYTLHNLKETRQARPSRVRATINRGLVTKSGTALTAAGKAARSAIPAPKVTA